MHELLLLGQVPGKRVEQVLSVLAGLTASQPQRRIERHILYRKQPVVKSSTQPAKAAGKTPQNVLAGRDSVLLRLIKDLDEKDFGSPQTSQQALQGWQLMLWDVPEPSQKRAILRLVAEIPLNTQDPRNQLKANDYSQVSQLLLEGHQFVIGNTILFLHRIRRFPDAGSGNLEDPLPLLSDTHLLDASQTMLLQASLRISDGSNTDLVNRALTELETLQNRLKGVVELSVPDRLSLDTRLK